MSDNETKNNKTDLKLVESKTKKEEEPINVADVAPAPPSTVYHLLMARMTPEQLASMGVQLIQVNGSELFWMTSVGQLYTFNNKQAALEAEYAWLMSAPN